MGQPLGLLRVAVTVVVVDLLLVSILRHALGVELGRSLHLLATLLYRHPAPARVGDGFHWDHEVLLAESQKASHPDVQKAHVSLSRVEVEVLHGPYLLPIPIVDVAVEQSLGSRVAGKIRVSKLDEFHRAKTSFAGRQSPIFPTTRSLVSKYLFDLRGSLEFPQNLRTPCEGNMPSYSSGCTEVSRGSRELTWRRLALLFAPAIPKTAERTP